MTRREFANRLAGARSVNIAPVIIEERDPRRWRRAFVEAVGGQGPVFLSNPDWGSRERADFKVLVNQSAVDWDPESGWLMIPTGGSSGVVKLARHDQSTLNAAVHGYQEFFSETAVSAVGVLPLHHVGGLMGWLRSALTGGDYVDGDWQKVRTLEGQLPSGEGKTISLVPTQLKTLFAQDVGAAWLRTFSRILIGGASLDDQLFQQATKTGIKLIRSYGATETAAMIAADDSASTGSNGLAVLPHASISCGKTGEFEVRGESVFRSYWPESAISEQKWNSGDLGECLSDGRIVIEGRADDLIISGGENINPREVERLLRSLLGDERLMILGVADVKWGEKVVVVHPPDLRVNLDELKATAREQIAAYKWPKEALVCDPWPCNSLGKLDRSKLRASIDTAVGQSPEI